MHTRKLAAGYRLFRQGDPADCAYIVRTGQVEIVREVTDGEVVVLDVVGRGAVIGEMGLIDNRPRSASARVVEAAEVVVIPAALFQARLDKLDPVFKKVLEQMVHRVRAGNDAQVSRAVIRR